MALTIRSGHAGDMQVALPLMLAQIREHAEADPACYSVKSDAEKHFRQWLGPAMEDPRHALFVAEEDGAMVGCMAVLMETRLPIYVVEEYAVVQMLWVTPEARGRGVAARMLDSAAKHYAALGVSQIRLAVTPAREAEHHVAEKAGFRAAAITYLRELRTGR